MVRIEDAADGARVRRRGAECLPVNHHHEQHEQQHGGAAVVGGEGVNRTAGAVVDVPAWSDAAKEVAWAAFRRGLLRCHVPPHEECKEPPGALK